MRRLGSLIAALAGLLAFSAPALASGPANSSIPVISGALTEGSQLAATQGVWVNATNAPSTFAYQWQRCNGASCINIPWATQSGYVPIRADTGATLKVTVTATSSGGSTSATSNAYGPIASNGQTAYYVDGASVGGTCSDSNTTTQAQSPSTPWCTMTHAASALATSTSNVEVLVRGADNAGTQQNYAGTGSINTNGRTGTTLLDLTNLDPTGTVTFEAYGTSTQADNVLVEGVKTNNSSNYTFEGFDIADPTLPSGCPYNTVVDAGGNLPLCFPQDDIQLAKGTSSVNFYDDSIPTQVNFATTQGTGAAPTNVTLYGDEIHHTGWDCNPVLSTTLNGNVSNAGAITSIAVASGGNVVGSGNTWRVGIYTGSASNPTTWDSFIPAAGSTSTQINVNSHTPTNSYTSGAATVVAESCNNANNVGIEANGAVNNLTVSHDQIDHSHCTGIQGGGGTNWTVTYTTIAYVLPPNTECHDDAYESTANQTNLTWTNNLVYEVNLGIFTGCNTPTQVQCGSNWTIDNNVFIAVSNAIEIGNWIEGTNYIENNTVWDGGAVTSGSIWIRWSDACCTSAPLAQDYIENNVTDYLIDNASGSLGNATQLVAAEDYNLLANQTSDPTGAGFGTHNVLNTQPSFASGVGAGCWVNDPSGSLSATSYAVSSCTGAATGFNAALLSASAGVGAGVNGGSIPTSDFLGNSRTVPYDMGAFQLAADSTTLPPNGGSVPLPPLFIALGAAGAAGVAGSGIWLARRRS